MRRFAIPTLMSFLLLAGCVSVTGIDAAKPVMVGDGITVNPQVAWASVSLPNVSDVFWTIDGIGLDELHFYTGIAPGQPLMKIPGKTAAEVGTYAATMLPNDVMDLLASSLEKENYQTVHSSGLTPVTIGSHAAFRFNLTFSTPSGLEMQGTALAIQQNGKLDVILFLAPREYYFAHCQPIVDKIFASVQIA